MSQAYVYILASRMNGTLYVGVTTELRRRVWQHKIDAVAGFTATHCVHRLVYMETHNELMAAQHRERTLKRWRRAWKVELIERDNPEWQDLYQDLQN